MGMTSEEVEADQDMTTEKAGGDAYCDERRLWWST